MTQVEFYSVAAKTEAQDTENATQVKPSRLPYEHLCEVVLRAYRKGQQVFIHTDNKSLAERIDERLWQQDPKSFLPHLLADEQSDTTPPIQIGFGQEPKTSPDVLINLSSEIPQFFSYFQWVFEYAYGDEENTEKARQKYRFYRERGYPLNHRKIQNQ